MDAANHGREALKAEKYRVERTRANRPSAMNPELARIHKVLLIPYMVVWVLLGLLFALHFKAGNLLSAFGVTAVLALPVSIHYAAMLGAIKGARWGRILSRVIGAFLLLGFPIGTMLGLYILNRTGSAWQNAASGVSGERELVPS